MADMYRRWSWVLSGLLLFSTASFVSTLNLNAQSPAPHTSGAAAQERTALVQSFATEKLVSWQKRLNLEDWKISIQVARASDLKPRTLGNIHWDTDKKTATIHVLDPADYKLPFPDVLADVEFTVVHELIHLELAPVLAPLQRNDANRREEEHAVNHMTDALLHLEREGKN
jgi:hypothetical protein